jgi:hypothetical protein
MCRRSGKLDKVQTRSKPSQSDRPIVLGILANCAQSGLGVLEEIPNLGSPFNVRGVSRR